VGQIEKDFHIQALVTQPAIKAQVDSGSGAAVGSIGFNYFDDVVWSEQLCTRR